MAALSRTEKEAPAAPGALGDCDLAGHGGLPPLPADLTPIMLQKRGCFVTLHKHGALRGCIGTLEPVKALGACVVENAINAAFRDPRFTPLDVGGTAHRGHRRSAC